MKKNTKKIKCHYCKDKLESGATDHHICYNPEETVPVCKKCHARITSQMKEARDKKGYYLCINCGRHFTSNLSKLCYRCEHKDSSNKDWFGLTFEDKTKPIYRYNYHWLETNWKKP